jgi:hypothetical protein
MSSIERYNNNSNLIFYWRMNQECISEEIPIKGQMTKEEVYNGYNMVSTLVFLYGQRFGKSLCIDMIKIEIQR